MLFKLIKIINSLKLKNKWFWSQALSVVVHFYGTYALARFLENYYKILIQQNNIIYGAAIFIIFKIIYGLLINLIENAVIPNIQVEIKNELYIKIVESIHKSNVKLAGKPEFVSRVVQNIEDLSNIIGDKIIGLISSTILIALILYIVFNSNVYFGFAYLTIFIISFCVHNYFSEKMSIVKKEYMNLVDESSGLASQIIQGAIEIRTYKSENAYIQRSIENNMKIEKNV